MNRMFKSPESTLEVLSYAIIMLNTITHNPNIKQNDRIDFNKFISITNSIDDGQEMNRDYLFEIYERVRANELKPEPDPVSAVHNFEKLLIGQKKPIISFGLQHRRLISCVKLYEVYDLTKKEKSNQHQRDVFLFNDMLVVRIRDKNFLFLSLYQIQFNYGFNYYLGNKSIHEKEIKCAVYT